MTAHVTHEEAEAIFASLDMSSLARGRLTSYIAQARKMEASCVTIREALQLHIDYYGGAPHRRDDCPEGGTCGDCLVDAAVNEALSLPSENKFVWCPWCRKRHVYEGEWATRPHHTHRCVDDATGEGCGGEWRLDRFVFGSSDPDERER